MWLYARHVEHVLPSSGQNRVTFQRGMWTACVMCLFVQHTSMCDVCTHMCVQLHTFVPVCMHTGTHDTCTH